MKFVGIEPVGATLFPEKLAAFPDLVEVAKTDPACCRVSETTSLDAGRVGDLAKALEIAPSGVPVAAGATSQLGTGIGRVEP
jgi:hypothetical protein